jgi:hypothetical protein
MKKLFLSLSLLACMAFFNACSTDVELYADYKDIPVIYGLIDATTDTNFVRINRAFCGSNDNPINAYEVALIADSCNYPGKLDARIMEYKLGFGNQYSPTGRVIMLDTITIHDKDTTGIFYAPDQKVYYTTETFKQNTESARYKYRLAVYKGNDTITSETGVVGGENFKILTWQTSFISDSTTNTGKISFTAADNTAFYDMKMYFNYREKHGAKEENKQLKWDFGTKSVDELYYDDQQKCFYVSYGMNSLFDMLERAIGSDTTGVTRYFDENPIEIVIAAGGEELYNYIQINAQAGGLSQSIPDYTNINGGYGVFSSRINKSRNAKISGRTATDLYGKTAWHFVQQ